jgi:outer membrane biosynthesis protein TonB
MAQTNSSYPEQSRTRSLLLFIGVGILLLGLVGGGIWLAKQRSDRLAGHTAAPEVAVTNNPQKPEQQPETKPQATTNPQPAQTQPQTTPNTQTQQPAPQAKPQVRSETQTTPQTAPHTGGSHLPSTGPADVAMSFTAILMSISTYLAIRLYQDRRETSSLL